MGYVKKLTDKAGKLRGLLPWLTVLELPRDPAAPQVRRPASKAHGSRREAAATLTDWNAAKARGDIDYILADCRRGRMAAAAAARADADSGQGDASPAPGTTMADPATWTVADLLRHWLDDHAAPHVRPRTLHLYRDTIERHLIPALGDVPLATLTPPRIQAAYTRLRREGVTDRGLALCHQRLNQALLMAERQDIITRNPAGRVTKPVYRPKEQPTWTEDEARRFLAVAIAPGASPYGPVWAIVLTTGLRRGELMGLRWEDVDLKRGVLYTRRAITRPDNSAALVAGETKTKNGVRELGLSAGIVAALRTHLIAQKEEWLRQGVSGRYAQASTNARAHGWPVFASAAGTPPHPSNLWRDYRRLIAVAGVPVITMHGARHSFASLALASGAPIKAVSAALGHSDPRITLRIYTHVTTAQTAAVSAALGDRLLTENLPEAARDTGSDADHAPADEAAQGNA